jgi:hypothetical protein
VTAIGTGEERRELKNVLEIELTEPIGKTGREIKDDIMVPNLNKYTRRKHNVRFHTERGEFGIPLGYMW